MGRKVLKAAKCSQMSNPHEGTGNGGDRCTEACAAIVAKTYSVPLPGLDIKRMSGEQVMYYFTQMLNKGSNTSALEDAAWINRWMGEHNGPLLGNVHLPSYQNIVDMIDRGHIGIGGFNNYAALRLSSGGNPYQWTDPSGLGHVLVIVGYDTAARTVIVHDPLRADPSGQPADYSWASFGAAGFADLSEVDPAGGTLPQSQSLLSGVGGAVASLAPDAQVVNFLVYLDQKEMVVNPFSNTSATIDSVGPVNFTDPVSWAGSVANNFWGDLVGVFFRLLIVGVGILILANVVRSWLPVKQTETAAMSGAQAAVMLA